MAAAKAKPKLGRGLSALLGENNGEGPRPAPTVPGIPMVDEAPGDASNDTAPRKLPLSALRRNAAQPRQVFDEGELAELTKSVQVKGVLSPILVRPDPSEPGAYQIVAGERRFRAAQKAGLDDVPVIIRDLEDREVLEVSIVENVQRSNLNPIEEAMGYRALKDEFGHTQDMIAKSVGKSRPHVANALRLLDLPPRVRDLLYEGALTAGHARAIASAKNVEGLAEQIVAEGLNVRQAEALARGEGEANTPSAVETAADRAPNKVPPKDQVTLELEKTISASLGLGVEIRNHGDAGGEVRIKFGKFDQLQDVIRRLQTPVGY